MTLADLIKLTSNRLTALNNEKATAVALGNIDQFERLDNEIYETQSTLVQLISIV